MSLSHQCTLKVSCAKHFLGIMFLVFMPLSVSGCPYETGEGGGVGGLYVAGGPRVQINMKLNPHALKNRFTKCISHYLFYNSSINKIQIIRNMYIHKKHY